MLTDSLAMMDIPKKIQVKNKLKDNPTIKVDPDKVKRIFIDIIKNSIDDARGGKIIVESHETKKGLAYEVLCTITE